jgi:anti-sigma regulatory factor (Ser/Thr protein kinase)
MLAVKYELSTQARMNNKKDTVKKTFKADKSDYNNAISWIEGVCDNLFIDKELTHKIVVITEEIFVNVLNYAYPNAQGHIEIELERESEKLLVMHFSDTGIPFNPLEHPKPDTTLSAQERAKKPGGLGIFMVKGFADKVDYKYLDGKNTFSIWVSR